MISFGIPIGFLFLDIFISSRITKGMTIKKSFYNHAHNGEIVLICIALLGTNLSSFLRNAIQESSRILYLCKKFVHSFSILLLCLYGPTYASFQISSIKDSELDVFIISIVSIIGALFSYILSVIIVTLEEDL